MKNNEWNNLRAKLHHDWLQKYFTLFDARADEMDVSIKGKRAVRSDIFKQFAVWQAKEQDFKVLVEETVDALSPKQLLDEYPLNRMSEENKAWLGELIHALYLERTKIKDKISELNVKFASISETHPILMRLLKGENDELRKRAGEQPIKRFYEDLKEFSRMLSLLPHGVLVT